MQCAIARFNTKLCFVWILDHRPPRNLSMSLQQQMWNKIVRFLEINIVRKILTPNTTFLIYSRKHNISTNFTRFCLFLTVKFFWLSHWIHYKTLNKHFWCTMELQDRNPSPQLFLENIFRELNSWRFSKKIFGTSHMHIEDHTIQFQIFV